RSRDPSRLECERELTMAVTKVVMPKLSEAMETGKIIKWLKKEGDKIQGGDILAEIETDKADVEMEAFGAGVLRKVLVAAGEKAPVGTLIGVIAEPGDDIAGVLASASAPAVAAGAGAASSARKDTRPEGAPAPPAPPAPAQPLRPAVVSTPAPAAAAGGARQAHAPRERARAGFLRHERGRDGPRLGAPRGAERAGGPAEGLGERPRRARLRAGAPPTPRRERLLPGRVDPRLAPRAHRHRGRARGRAHHARAPGLPGEVACPDRRRGA